MTATVYEWKCKACGVRFDEFARDGVVECPGCSSTATHRTYSFAMDRTSLRPFNNHWNPNLGKVITSQAQLQSEMRAASDRASQQTGFSHDFQTADLRDKDVFGVKSQVNKEAHLLPTMERHANPTMTKAVKEILDD